MLSDAEYRRQYELFLHLSRHAYNRTVAELLKRAVVDHVREGWTFESSWGGCARLFRTRRGGLFGKEMIDTLVVKVDSSDHSVSREQWEESMAERRRRDAAMPDFSEDMRRLGF
ncbi:hypothetical protein [Microbacterium sp.]|uniref:hypothetical protein n=1 Tax=Microbacterium sp. TaxID=51671 RepID=UPI002D769232|nr:hypothetical protein [Microbacterium sp.]HET6301851.1 hypothetical protein [Microbacterium sp.]